MLALELVNDRTTKQPSPEKAKTLLEATKEEGLLLGLGGSQGNAIRIAPSMLVTEEEIAEGLDRLGRACARVPA